MCASCEAGCSLAAAVILAIDQGTTGTTCLVVDPGGPSPAAASAASRSSTTRGRAGSSTTPRRSGKACWRPPPTRWRRPARGPRSGRDRHHQPARDDAVVGSRARARRSHRAIVWQDRRTADACRQLPAELLRERTGLCPIPTSRPPSWRGCSSTCRASARAGGARLRHRRQLAGLAADRRRACTSPIPPTRRGRCSSLRHAGLGRRAAGAVRRAARRAAASRAVERRSLGETRAVRRGGADGRHRRRPAGRALRAGLRAPGRPRTPTAPALPAGEHGERRAAPRTGWCDGRLPSRRRDSRSRARCSWPGRRVQWLRDGLGMIADAAESERWRARSTATACTSCPR